MHDPRVGRFFAVDPLAPSFPWNSPYSFSENSTMVFVELEGLERASAKLKFKNGKPVLKHIKIRMNGLFEFGEVWTIKFEGELYDFNRNPASAYNRVDDLLRWMKGKAYNNETVIDEEGYYDREASEKIRIFVPATKEAFKERYKTRAEMIATEEAVDEAVNKDIQKDILESCIIAAVMEPSPFFRTMPFMRMRMRKVTVFPNVTVRPSPTLIKNKLPVSQNGRIIGTIQKGKVHVKHKSQLTGRYDFIVDKTGNIILGRKHTYMSKGEDVMAAGEIKLRNGKVVGVNNASGHYEPTIEQGKNFLKILEDQGVDVSNAVLELYGPKGREKTVNNRNK